MSSTNLEEAAALAAEYIYSLDNLPAEVQFLLAEMKAKDTRAQELHNEIQKEGGKYIRHSLRSAPNQPLSAKDQATPAMVQAHFAEIDKLSQEKQQLGERIVQLIERAQKRLDRDVIKILTLQGEPQVEPTPAYYYYGASRNPVAQLNESLRSAISIPETPMTPVAPAPAGPLLKKRRMVAAASAGSIKLPSPAPATVPVPQHTGGAGSRSRLSQQVHTATTGRGRRAATSLGPDEDAEGDDDVEDEAAEDNGDADDQALYCFCQKMSYGEMIACDYDDCPYQWFHLPCVSLKPPLPEKWYCSHCIEKYGASVSTGHERRKGRKKQ